MSRSLDELRRELRLTQKELVQTKTQLSEAQKRNQELRSQITLLESKIRSARELLAPAEPSLWDNYEPNKYSDQV